MADRLSPHYIELVCDAALKCYWRRNALASFLRRCGISQSRLATWSAEERKRDFLTRLFPDLEGTDAGIRLINTMADALVQQSTFPDLEGWEDSDFKKEQARKAVSALKEFLREQKDAAATERERAASRTRASKIQAEAQKRQMSLDKFSERLAQLSIRLGTQQAGYDFQDWFYDVAEFFEVVARRPYVSGGRQIDGSVSVDGTTYLVELKFTSEQADAIDIDTFHRKVTSKADNTMGIFLSISGFSSVAIEGASGPKTPLLLFDHSHVYRLLGGGINFVELITRVRRHCSQTGQAFLKIEDFGG
jgi:hypothetical protein